MIAIEATLRVCCSRSICETILTCTSVWPTRMAGSPKPAKLWGLAARRISKIQVNSRIRVALRACESKSSIGFGNSTNSRKCGERECVLNWQRNTPRAAKKFEQYGFRDSRSRKFDREAIFLARIGNGSAKGCECHRDFDRKDRGRRLSSDAKSFPRPRRNRYFRCLH